MSQRPQQTLTQTCKCVEAFLGRRSHSFVVDFAIGRRPVGFICVHGTLMRRHLGKKKRNENIYFVNTFNCKIKRDLPRLISHLEFVDSSFPTMKYSTPENSDYRMGGIVSRVKLRMKKLHRLFQFNGRKTCTL